MITFKHFNGNKPWMYIICFWTKQTPPLWTVMSNASLHSKGNKRHLLWTFLHEYLSLQWKCMHCKWNVLTKFSILILWYTNRKKSIHYPHCTNSFLYTPCNHLALPPSYISIAILGFLLDRLKEKNKPWAVTDKSHSSGKLVNYFNLFLNLG